MTEETENFEQTALTLSYEEAFSRLEEVVAALERGDQTLGNALLLFEQGKMLAKRCSQLLDQAELKIKLIAGEDFLDFEP